MNPKSPQGKPNKRKRETNRKIDRAVLNELARNPHVLSLDVAEVARKAGVSRSTVYRNFGNLNNVVAKSEKLILIEFETEIIFFSIDHRPIIEGLEIIGLTIERNREHFSSAVARGDFCAIRNMFDHFKPRICASYKYPEHSEFTWGYINSEIRFIVKEWHKEDFKSSARSKFVESVMHIIDTAEARAKPLLDIKNSKD